MLHFILLVVCSKSLNSNKDTSHTIHQTPVFLKKKQKKTLFGLNMRDKKQSIYFLNAHILFIFHYSCLKIMHGSLLTQGGLMW